MGRVIRHIIACSADQFAKNAGRFNLHKIEGAEAYCDGDRFVLVASPDWRDYLHGKRDDFPDETEHGVFEVDPADLGILFEFE